MRETETDVSFAEPPWGFNTTMLDFALLMALTPSIIWFFSVPLAIAFMHMAKRKRGIVKCLKTIWPEITASSLRRTMKRSSTQSTNSIAGRRGNAMGDFYSKNDFTNGTYFQLPKALVYDPYIKDLSSDKSSCIIFLIIPFYLRIARRRLFSSLIFFLNFNTVLLFKKWFLYIPFVQGFREILKKRNSEKRKFGQEDAESLSDSCWRFFIFCTKNKNVCTNFQWLLKAFFSGYR